MHRWRCLKIGHIGSLGQWVGPMFAVIGSVMESIFWALVESGRVFVEVC